MRSNSNNGRMPPFRLLLVSNGSKFTLPPSGFHSAGPYNLTNNSEWAPSGSWWESNGTTDCFVIAEYYAHWNNLSPPTHCDGRGFLRQSWRRWILLDANRMSAPRRDLLLCLVQPERHDVYARQRDLGHHGRHDRWFLQSSLPSARVLKLTRHGLGWDSPPGQA
jgi:hypothetical protein